MTIACEVRRGYVKDPNDVKILDLDLRFSRGGESEEEFDPLEQGRRDKETMLGMMGGPDAVTVVDTLPATAVGIPEDSSDGTP